MKTIELKPKPFQCAIQVFLFVFVSFSISKYALFGWYSDPDILLFLRARAIEALAGTAAYCLVLAIPVIQGRFDILLGESTLQAPMKKKRLGFIESSSVDLSDLSINRSFRDKLIGTQVVTNSGEPLLIHSLFYNSKAISKLLDEIDRRKESTKNPNQNIGFMLKTPTE